MKTESPPPRPTQPNAGARHVSRPGYQHIACNVRLTERGALCTPQRRRRDRTAGSANGSGFFLSQNGGLLLSITNKYNAYIKHSKQG